MMKNNYFSINNLVPYLHQEEMTLDRTRDKIIKLSFYIGIVASFFFLLNRSFNGTHVMVLAAFTALIASTFFLFLCYKGYSQPVIIAAGMFYLIMAFHEGNEYNIPIQTIIYFSLMPVMVAFLIKNQIIRIIYLVISLVAFVMLTKTTGYLSGVDYYANLITFLAIDIILYILALAFIQLMETQQKNLHQAILEKNRALELLESKHQDLILFNNMMNHDIKAPLRTIKGFTGLLKRTLKTEKQFEYIDFIKNSANNLEQLISDLLLYSKMNMAKLELSNININEIIDSICDSLQFDIKQKNVQISKIELPETIYGNSEALRTVFQNLISNSIKYQPKDKEGHIPEINITYKKGDVFDAIYVKDNGIGISKEHVPRLFTPFVRFQSAVDYEGTGLGLSICKKIMEKHRGEISLLQEVEQGTCFKLKFQK